MLKNSYKMIFLFTLFLGTLISISSNSWLSIWMGLEINLLSFIPLSMKTNNLFSSEASLKYFLVQALASSMLLFSIIFYFFFLQYYKFLMIEPSMMMMINLIFSSTLMLKSGIAPFHFWFPNVMEGLNWMNNFILMTWQKIAPLIILSFSLNYFLFIFSILFSIFIGSINGLNQTSLRKLMAYSSINHLGWMISAMLSNENIWKIYFLLYSFLIFCIIFSLKSFKIFNLNQMFSFFNKNNNFKFMFSFPLLSLGGLPPFLGFFPKWIIIEMMIFFKFYLMIIFMIIFSLITLYFYIRMCYSSLLMNFNKMNLNFFNLITMKNKKMIFFLNFISMFGLIFINFLFLM